MAAWRFKKAIDVGKAVRACMQIPNHIHHWPVLVANDEAAVPGRLLGIWK